MIPLMISLSSLGLSYIAYAITKKQSYIQEIYLNKLKQNQLELSKLQNYVTAKRNHVNKEITRLSCSNGRNTNNHINSLTMVDEYLKDIETCIQSLLDYRCGT